MNATASAELESQQSSRRVAGIRNVDVYSALVAISSPGQEINPALFEGIDWERVLSHARHHSLVPLLAHRLLDCRGLHIPAHIRFRLRNDFQSNLVRNFGLTEEIKRILQAWSDGGIPAIPYKGPVLAEQLWESFALRDCSDLDFLVRRHDVQRAARTLQELGYRAESPIAESLRSALLRNASEEQFRHSGSNLLLELQWAPAPRTLAVSFDEEQLWRDRINISVAGETFNSPSPEDLFALLAIHGWKHNWSKLIWISDLLAVMRRYDLDWARLDRSATRGGWRRILLLAIAMLWRVYGVDPVFDGATDPGIASLAERLERSLRLAKNHTYLEWHRDMLCARDSRASQLRQLVQFIFTPGLAEYSAARLPAWASAGHRLIRVGRVLKLWPEKART